MCCRRFFFRLLDKSALQVGPVSPPNVSINKSISLLRPESKEMTIKRKRD